MARILVVEDEPALAICLANDLRLEGYEVEVAREGETAVEKGNQPEFDLILLDIMLPGKDGFEVCRELRRAGVRTPIILLTARTQEAEKVLGLELGADDYVTKPFSSKELRARIKAALRRAAPELPSTCRFGQIEVDFQRCELRRRGKPVEVTALELKLLEAFVRSRGRALTREQLLDEVWGPGTSLSDRVVDNHITRLRKKIELKPAKPRYLVSVRGIGYRFDG
jgi:two-component system alkaline phosphatase synthesis response regulator PhoP